jgi:hypothetical protein
VCASTSAAQLADTPPSQDVASTAVLLPSIDSATRYVLGPADLGIGALKSASIITVPDSGGFWVRLQFTGRGAEQFRLIAAKRQANYIAGTSSPTVASLEAVEVDGAVAAAPAISSTRDTGGLTLTGPSGQPFTKDQATVLTRQINQDLSHSATNTNPTSVATTLPGSFTVPNLVGLSLSQAEHDLPTVPGQGPQITLNSEVVDQSKSPGTIISQSPAAGATALGVTISIAVPPTTPCSSAQLRLSYRGGGAGAGNDFGNVVVRNTSGTWCLFTGPVQVVGLNISGQPITQTVTYQVSQAFALSPDAAPPPTGQQPPLSEIETNISLAAEYRDGPQPDGLCDTMQIVPAAWQVSVPGAAGLTVVNDDPSDIGYPGFQRLITCRGQMDQPSGPLQLGQP